MRKINRRNFLKAAGVLSAAVAGSLLAGCGGSDTGAGAAASDLPAYNELIVGTDHTDLTATIKVINHRTDLIQDGTFDGYVAEFQKLYPNITIEYEGITDYAGDMTTRLTSQEWGDVCMIPTTIPLTELGDYFYPMCDLSGIQEDYNFAANRAFDGIQLLEDTTAPDEIADLATNVQQEAELMLNADQTHVKGGRTMNEIAALKAKRLVLNVVKYAFLIFAAFVALVPIVSCIFTAFKIGRAHV